MTLWLNHSAGMALVVVIWALVILVSVVAGFTLAVRHQIRLAVDIAERAQQDAAFQTAVSRAILGITSRVPERRWLANRKHHTVGLSRDLVSTVRVGSEIGKVDLNLAPNDLMQNLIRVVDSSHNAALLVDEVVDWRDRDKLARPEGAEEPEYRAAGRAIGPPNRPFRSIHELSRVLHFDRELVQSLLPHITVESRQPKVNVWSAGRVVLEAIPGVDPVSVENFLEARAAINGNEPTVQIGRLGGNQKFIDTNIVTYHLDLEIEIQKNGEPWARRLVTLRRAQAGYVVAGELYLPLSSRARGN